MHYVFLGVQMICSNTYVRTCGILELVGILLIFCVVTIASVGNSWMETILNFSCYERMLPLRQEVAPKVGFFL
jgi:hypothetical protein